MPYLHVLVATESSDAALRCIFRNLSEATLQSSFLAPYRRGRNLLSGGEIIVLSSVRKVLIIQTEEDCQSLLQRHTNEERERLHREQKENRTRGVAFFSLPYAYSEADLPCLGKDVTSRYISEAPSPIELPSFLKRLLSNALVVGVVGAVIAAGIVAWLGWG